MMKALCFAILLFCQCSTIAQTYTVFQENGKSGLKDYQGVIVIPASYAALGWSNNDFSVIDQVTGYQSNGHWGLINVANRIITKAEFTKLYPGEGSLLIAEKKSKASLRLATGCINTTGKEIIPFHYDGIKVSSLRAIVYKQNKYGLIDLDNKILIPISFQNIQPLGNLRYAVENFQNKKALFTENGKPLTAFLSDNIQPYKKNFAVFQQQGKEGLLDRDGLIHVIPEYKAIAIEDDGTIKGIRFDEWIILDGLNKAFQRIEADSIIPLKNNLFKLQRGNSTQLVNAQFEPISQLHFSTIYPFERNKAIFKQNDRYGIISSNGTILIESNYERLISTKNFIIAKKNHGQWILLDSIGNIKTAKSYERIEPFNGIFLPVKNRSYYGAIDPHGKEIISCVYDSIEQFTTRHLAVKFHGSYGIIDYEENWLIAPQRYPLKLASTDRYFMREGPTTFLKSFHNTIIYFTDNPIEIKSGFFLEHVSTGGVWKVDFDGRIISRQLPPVDPYQEILPETEGLRGIKKDGRYGFIDDRGRLRIANRYEDVKPFQDRLAAIKIRNKWGFVDHDEKLVIQPVYDETTSFQNGVAIIKIKGLYGLINKKGTLILQPRYETITRIPTKRFLLNSNDLTGLADSTGRLISPPKFHNIVDLNNGYVIVERDKKYGLLTTHGISTVPLQYDLIIYDRYNARYFALKKTMWSTLSTTN